MFGKFSNRSDVPEIMDDLACSGEVVHQTLRELDFINAWLGGNRITIQAIKKLLHINPTSDEITLGDLGCGSGDMLKSIHNTFNRSNKKLKLIGYDANPNIIEYAKRHNSNLDIRLVAENILSASFRTAGFDIVTATLFFHHFTNDQLVSILNALKSQARLGIIINDLHRHPLAYYSIRLLTSLFSRSSMVKYDAPLSVLRGFSRHELLTILNRAQIKNFDIRWKWAFRWQVIIYT